MSEARIGLGVDTHPSAPGRPLYLGGVHFPDEPGLAGHSDGDVICHALADALLGAAGLGDLGEHFSDDDPAYAGAAGLDLLGRVAAMLVEGRLAVRSCDLTLIADRPHITGRRAEVRQRLARALGIDVAGVSVKATRPEGLGLTGDGAGCIAVALVGPLAPEA